VRRSALPLVALALAVLGAGCGSDESTLEVASSLAGATIEADSIEERKIALEVQEYFMRNCPLPGAIRSVTPQEHQSSYFDLYKRQLNGSEAMCGHIASIAVDGTRVTIRSDIPPDAEKGAGEAFCNLIHGADVADLTPGHELQNLDGDTVRACPTG
jgi:hypothetical protein